jgi:hypothetical protein
VFLASLSLLRLIGSLHRKHLLLKILTSVCAYSYQRKVYYNSTRSNCQYFFKIFI